MIFFKILPTIFFIFLGKTTSAQDIKNAIHFGLQFGNFYELSEPPSSFFKFHTGSVPLVLGYERYFTPNYGIGVSAFFSLLKSNDFFGRDPIQTSSLSTNSTRNTEVRGININSKYWHGDFAEEKFNIGFETGIGFNYYKFSTFYSSRVSNQSEWLYTNKLLIPFRIGLNFIAYTANELSISYNFIPFLGNVNDSYTSPESNITYTNPNLRRSFVTVTFKRLLIWD